MRKLPREIENKIHNKIQTKDNAPSVSLEITRPRMPIQDSSYWTVEEIRTLEGIGDIAVTGKRERPYGRPTKLYEIHTENGIVRTAYRAYPDIEKNGWIESETIESGESVAICFESEFHHRRKKWRTSTVGEPFIFWTDMSGNLKMKRWGEDISTHIVVAENVKNVSAISGWKNKEVGVDLGLIVAYVKKDGKVYYRQLIDSEFTNEFELEGSENTRTISLMRTNDYRVGFVRSGSNGTTYHLTRRYWSGMAIERHAIDSIVSAKVNAVRVTHEHEVIDERIVAKVTARAVAARIIDFAVVSAINELFTEIKVQFSHIIGNTDNEEIKNSITLSDSTGTRFPVIDVSINGQTLTITSSGFSGVKDYIDIKFRGSVLYAINDMLPFYLKRDTVFQFVPVFPVVVVPVREKINMNMSADVVTTRVAHKHKAASEKIVAQVDAQVTLTKTGVSPL